MIGLLRSLLSQAGLTGLIIGVVAGYIFHDLIKAGIAKIIKKNG